MSFPKTKWKIFHFRFLRSNQLKFLHKSMFFDSRMKISYLLLVVQGFTSNKIIPRQVFCMAFPKVKWKSFHFRFLRSTNSNYSTKSMIFDSRIKIDYLFFVVRSFTTTKNYMSTSYLCNCSKKKEKNFSSLILKEHQRKCIEKTNDFQ